MITSPQYSCCARIFETVDLHHLYGLGCVFLPPRFSPLSDIKKSFFGFKKDDVYKYFSELSDDFSKKLKRSEKMSEKRIEELLAKNNELEEKLAEMSLQNARYQAELSNISKQTLKIQCVETVSEFPEGTVSNKEEKYQENIGVVQELECNESLSLFHLKKE